MSKPHISVESNEAHGIQAVRENREALETLAETDLCSAKWAKELLDALDAEGST